RDLLRLINNIIDLAKVESDGLAMESVAFNLRYPKQFGFAWRNGQLLERIIRISTRRGDAPKIHRVQDPDGLLDIEVLESEGPITSIRTRVREAALEKIDDGATHELIVHTDDPDEPRLVLEYRVTAPLSRAGAAAAARGSPAGSR
ncbi:MAG: hypothetical protein KDK70_22945, partial [Myxococcales bacterium]|nr:hypothetical protein [Myxococcales bacterium]